jgi:hypothetical protein
VVVEEFKSATPRRKPLRATLQLVAICNYGFRHAGVDRLIHRQIASVNDRNDVSDMGRLSLPPTIKSLSDELMRLTRRSLSKLLSLTLLGCQFSGYELNQFANRNVDALRKLSAIELTDEFLHFRIQPFIFHVIAESMFCHRPIDVAKVVCRPQLVPLRFIYVERVTYSGQYRFQGACGRAEGIKCMSV